MASARFSWTAAEQRPRDQRQGRCHRKRKSCHRDVDGGEESDGEREVLLDSGLILIDAGAQRAPSKLAVQAGEVESRDGGEDEEENGEAGQQLANSLPHEEPLPHPSPKRGGATTSDNGDGSDSRPHAPRGESPRGAWGLLWRAAAAVSPQWSPLPASGRGGGGGNKKAHPRIGGASASACNSTGQIGR